MRQISLLIVLLFCSMTLIAQAESLAETIRLDFVTLNSNSSYNELNEFLQDYSMYQLQIMYWQANAATDPIIDSAFFVFNKSLMGEDDIVELLQNDTRVTNVKHTDSPRARQIVMRLNEGVNEADFLSDYSPYRLRGSIDTINYPYHLETRWFSFDDTKIYSGDLINLLEGDDRVDIAELSHGWKDGEIRIRFKPHTCLEDFEEFAELFHYLEFFNPFPFWTQFRFVRFDFAMYDEFHILYEIQNHPIVLYANFMEFEIFSIQNGVRPQQPNASDKDTTVPHVSERNIFVYPNPVTSDNVKFGVRSSDVNIWDTRYEIRIFNIKGQHITRDFFVGNTFVWNSRDENNSEVPSGIYFYQIKADKDIHTGKLLIIK